MTASPSGSYLGRSLVALLGVSLVPSFALAAPRVPTHVACVGDSITYGYLASNPTTKSYPAILQGLFGASVQVKNFGHNGATMLSAPYGDLPYEDLAEYAAATSFVSGAGVNGVVDVVMLLGTNDSKSFNWTPSGKPKNDQQFLTDYRAMLERFGALRPKPQIFLGLPLSTGTSPCCSIDGTVIHDQIVPLIKQLAAEQNLPIIDLNTPTANQPQYFSDGVHPTDEAYALVAKWVHDGLLVDLGAGGVGGSSAGGANGVGGNGVGGNGVGGTGVAGSPGNGGSAGLASAAAGNASHGGAPDAGAGPSAAGASPVGVGSGGAGAGVAAGNPSNSAAPEAAGCALSSHTPGSRVLFLFGLLGLSGLAARRRRPGA